ncbi:MAG: pyridoxal-phosphate dependent enzyme [Clostridia bacterium]|nr:pyridoxal-phosphate dependent enzyme [Clostridia bacterium]
MIELQNLKNKILKPLITPLIKVYDKKNNNILYIKDETVQYTGAFKYRGVYNKIINTDLNKFDGVITASTGNHGQAVANICNQINLKSFVVVPFKTPQIKIQKIQNNNANIICNDTLTEYEECVNFAKRFAKKNNLIYIPSFDDVEIIKGHQSMLEEISKKRVKINIAYCQIGGGGLISALATSKYFENIEIYGVELEGAESMKISLENNKISAVNIDLPKNSFCEGVLVSKIGTIPFNILKNKQIKVKLVNEQDVKNAIKFLGKYGIKSEGAGALGVAQYLKSNLKDSSVLCIISGGNINQNIWEEIVR